MTRAITHNPPPQVLIDVVNPLVRFALRSPLHGVLDPALLTLHVSGRVTGRRYDIPVGYVDIDGRLVVVTEHRWRGNLRGVRDVDVTYRGRRTSMHAQLDEEPARVAFILRAAIEKIGWQAAGRQLGLTVTARRTPTVAELEEAVQHYDLGTITLTPAGSATERQRTARQGAGT
jgi:hypothetical protein